MTISALQATIYQGYGTAAGILGQTCDQYRPQAPMTSPLASGNKLLSVPAQFTSGKTSGFNFDKALNYDDALLAGLFDASAFEIGDYLVNEVTGEAVFVAAMDNLLPVLCVRCNRTISLSRSKSDIAAANGGATPVQQPSQQGGQIPYFGRQIDPVGTPTPDNTTLVTGVPVCMVANAGRATGQVETPSGAPGPSRWRIYLPISVFPKGSVLDRDIAADEEGNRHMISAAVWTNLGYRVEAIREEV